MFDHWSYQKSQNVKSKNKRPFFQLFFDIVGLKIPVVKLDAEIFRSLFYVHFKGKVVRMSNRLERNVDFVWPSRYNLESTDEINIVIRWIKKSIINLLVFQEQLYYNVLSVSAARFHPKVFLWKPLWHDKQVLWCNTLDLRICKFWIKLMPVFTKWDVKWE